MLQPPSPVTGEKVAIDPAVLARWWPDDCFATVALQRFDSGDKRVVRALTRKEAIDAAALVRLSRQHPDAEFAVEPPKLSDVAGFDIDRSSIYKTAETVASIRATAEQLGLITFVSSSSLNPDGTCRGIRVWVYLGKKISRYRRAALVNFIAHRAGLVVAPGQLELIPQLTPFRAAGPGLTQRFSPPFQTDQSILLEDDLTPGIWNADQSAEIAAGMAAGVDTERVQESIDAALRWHRLVRPREQRQKRLQALPALPDIPMGAGASNAALLKLAGAYASYFRLSDGDEVTHHRLFLAWIQQHPSYDTISTSTRADLENGSRCERLLLCAIRRRSPAARSRGGAAASPRSNAGRQRQALESLLEALPYAAQSSWRSGRQLCQWLVTYHQLSRAWLMSPLIRPLWAWCIGDGGDRSPSPEYRQAWIHVFGEPERPENPVAAQTAGTAGKTGFSTGAPSYICSAWTTFEDGVFHRPEAVDPAADPVGEEAVEQAPMPLWVLQFDQARIDRREQWKRSRRPNRRQVIEDVRSSGADRAIIPELSVPIQMRAAAEAREADYEFMAGLDNWRPADIYRDPAAIERRRAAQQRLAEEAAAENAQFLDGLNFWTPTPAADAGASGAASGSRLPRISPLTLSEAEVENRRFLQRLDNWSETARAKPSRPAPAPAAATSAAPGEAPASATALSEAEAADAAFFRGLSNWGPGARSKPSPQRTLADEVAAANAAFFRGLNHWAG